MLGAMHKQCATHVLDAMHVRTDELTNADLSPTERADLALGNARENTSSIHVEAMAS